LSAGRILQCEKGEEDRNRKGEKGQSAPSRRSRRWEVRGVKRKNQQTWIAQEMAKRLAQGMCLFEGASQFRRTRKEKGFLCKGNRISKRQRVFELKSL